MKTAKQIAAEITEMSQWNISGATKEYNFNIFVQKLRSWETQIRLDQSKVIEKQFKNRSATTEHVCGCTNYH